MLLLPEGQTGEAWEPEKSNALSAIGEKLTVKYFALKVCTTTIRITECNVELEGGETQTNDVYLN